MINNLQKIRKFVRISQIYDKVNKQKVDPTIYKKCKQAYLKCNHKERGIIAKTIKRTLKFYFATLSKDRFETEVSDIIKRGIKEQVDILIKIGQC